MAVKKGVNVGSVGTPVIKFEGVQAGDTFEWRAGVDYVGEMLVGAEGTWGGASIGFLGRFEDGSSEIALIDLADAAIAITADPTVAIPVKHVWPEIAPALTGGDGTTLLDVYISYARIR